MKRLLALSATIFLALAGTAAAQAPTCPTNSNLSPKFTAPGNVFGRLAAQWNQYFTSKADANGGIICNPTLAGNVRFGNGSLKLGGALTTVGLGPVEFDFPSVAVTYVFPTIDSSGPSPITLMDNHAFNAVLPDARVDIGAQPTANVIDYGASPGNNTFDNATAFQAAVDSLDGQAGDVWIPPGNWCTGTTINIPHDVNVFGSGPGTTYVHSCNFTDTKVFAVNGDRAQLHDMAVTGARKIGATKSAITASGVEQKLANLRVDGGAHAIDFSGAADWILSNSTILESYGSAAVYCGSACGGYILRTKIDQQYPGATPSHGAISGILPWAATTTYATSTSNAPVIVSLGGYLLEAVTGGLSGSTSPTLPLYETTVNDGTVVWGLVGPVTYYGVQLDTGAAAFGMRDSDMTGPFTAGFAMTNTLAGAAPQAAWLSGNVFGNNIQEGVLANTGSELQVTDSNQFSNCTEAGCTGYRQTGSFTGPATISNNIFFSNPVGISIETGTHTIITGNQLSGSSTACIRVSAGVTDFVVDQNHAGQTSLWGACAIGVQVLSGASDFYTLAWNDLSGATIPISDAGTGTHKLVWNIGSTATNVGIRTKLQPHTTTFNVDPSVGDPNSTDCHGTGALACKTLNQAFDIIFNSDDFNGTSSGQSVALIQLLGNDDEELHLASHDGGVGAQGHAAITLDLGGFNLSFAAGTAPPLGVYHGVVLVLQNGTLTSSGGQQCVEAWDHGFIDIGASVILNCAGSGVFVGRDGNIIVDAYGGGDAAKGITFTGIGASSHPFDAQRGGSIEMPSTGGTINLGASLTGGAFLSSQISGHVFLNNPTFALNGHTYTGLQVAASQNGAVQTNGGVPFGTGSSLTQGGTWDGANPAITAGYTGQTSNTKGFVAVTGTNGPMSELTASPGVASTDGSGNPQVSGTLPNGINLGAATATSIGSLTAPVNPGDAANKQYVDSIAGGTTQHAAAQAATTANLTATYANGSSGVGATLTNSGTQAAFAVDGYSASINDRILVKDQTTQFQNGIYTVTTVGNGSTNWVLTRAADFNTVGGSGVAAGAAVIVVNGTVNGKSQWIETGQGPFTIGVTAIVFSQVVAGASGTVDSGTGPAIPQYKTGTGTEVQPVTVSGDATLAQGGALTIANNAVTNAKAAQMAANTVKGNATSALANATDLPVPSCSTSSSALQYVTNSGFACGTSINAATLNGGTFASPGPIGGSTPGTGIFGALTANNSLTANSLVTLRDVISFGLRDTSAAFDVLFAATSSTPLSTTRTLTWDLVNGSRTIKLGSNLTVLTDPGGVVGVIKADGLGTFTLAGCLDLSDGGTACRAATGTSGHVLGFLDGNDTFSGNNTHTGAETFAEVHGGGRTIPGTTDAATVADCGKTLHFTNNASPVTETIPANITQECTITGIQEGSQQVQFVAASGATIISFDSFTRTAGPWAVVDIIWNSGTGANAHYTLAGRGAP